MIRLVFSKLFKNLVIEFLLEQLYVNFLKIHIVSHDIRIKKLIKKKKRPSSATTSCRTQL